MILYFYHAQRASILSVVVLVNGGPLEVVNLYSPNKTAAPLFLASHHPLRDGFLAEEVNSRHRNWSREKTIECEAVMHASRHMADAVVRWTERNQYVLLNEIGTSTHFPRMVGL